MEIMFRMPKVGHLSPAERTQRCKLEKDILDGAFLCVLHWVVSLRKALDHGG